jgi:hypothetical protein
MNLRAIALGLEALRKVERYGIAERGQQYAGFAQIGAGTAMGQSLDHVMTADEAARIVAEGAGAMWSANDLFLKSGERRHRRGTARVPAGVEGHASRRRRRCGEVQEAHRSARSPAVEGGRMTSTETRFMITVSAILAAAGCLGEEAPAWAFWVCIAIAILAAVPFLGEAFRHDTDTDRDALRSIGGDNDLLELAKHDPARLARVSAGERDLAWRRINRKRGLWFPGDTFPHHERTVR